ncbi:hypothetical protein C8035_v004075 [Colletotrichum spinosum]|uniref:Uncharacterized protein n=1 Tax=Colletotrichum spinosum TaxID=1347390 RepID=A0A4R8QMV3_9PEZI|nr:hypothetical protein C8035_v004075 [Colletotrichum spinosum]
MRVVLYLPAFLYALSTAAQSGSCCTSNSIGQVFNLDDQTQACCTDVKGRWEGGECWIANLDGLTSCCSGKGSKMCSF